MIGKDSVSKKKQKSLLKMIKELDNIAHLDNHKKIYATNVVFPWGKTEFTGKDF